MVTHYKGIVDHRGKPIEKRVLTQEVAGPSITGVRSPLTGYPGDGLTPQRLNAILKEADQGQPLRFYELAEQIEERDLHYAAVLGVRKRSVAQIDISVKPAGEDKASIDQAEMIENWLTRDELADEVFEILDSIGKGESFTETTWDTSEGQWRPLRLERRDQRWFRPDRLDLTTPKLITGAGDDIELPPGKFVHMVARGKSGIPARSGLARLAMWFWLFKGMTTRDWAIYTATFGQPLRLGKYGPNASEAEKDTLFRAVANIAGDCAAIIPSSMTIEFEQPSSTTSTEVFERRADWLDRQMSKATLGQTTTTDAISGGHAVSKEHRQVQEDIERADAKALAAAINRDLVKIWIDLEYGPQKAYPRIVIGRPDEEDLTQLADAIAKFVPLGLRISSAEVRGKYGLSEPKDDEEVLVHTPAPVVGPPGTDPAGKPKPRALPTPKGAATEEEDEDGEETRHQVENDPAAAGAAAEAETIAQLTAESAGLLDALLSQVLAGIVNDPAVQDIEDVRSRLLAIAPQLSAGGMARALRQAIVVAQLSGRAGLALDG
jgi:phage gp29-like protein